MSSNWTYCFTAADGEKICTDIPIPVGRHDEIPPDWQDVLTMAQIDALAAQLSDGALRSQVVSAVDSGMIELNKRLPGKTTLRRVARA
jgi:hypothetical protein